ncbi:glycerol-3-phosphate transporter ATP-binding subunit (plasmid) [Antarctobacter heliothermus]|uniref:Glycerol-3-phosphate transporter ATP-binding subunit n=1 Tax=Antarctobacter heliothermus TaxID=74033 RepID=A0A222EBZ3_9RHOB|nr:ABC transporter ATP-binding protein [Antarctobacter heliothermus]ASP23713.1 glycerol-3-phosphate transporter ATP-binding subunit [Antarctobacter heliothermus]
MFDERNQMTDTKLKPQGVNSLASPEMLKIENVGLRYGDVTALDEINLDVCAREFVALLGPSGCGKTSLLRSIAGFNLPQEGRIVLNGKDVADLQPRQRNIGIVFQNYALFPHMTVRKNVGFGLECRRLSTSEIDTRSLAALDKVRLAEFADRRPRELSGGQQQRVALARAIAFEPSLLLLDEPLGALDKQLRSRMQFELKELQRSLGITAIFVTHDQDEAVAMADRIVVMRDGRIQQIATPYELFARPATAWVGKFIDAGNLLSGEVRADGDRWSVQLPGGFTAGAKAPTGVDRARAKLLLPAHHLEVTTTPEATPYRVVSIRPNGMALDLLIACGELQLRAQLPINRLGDFDVGDSVRLAAAPGGGTWLPDD